MKVRLILHLIEFLLALAYAIYIWPLYEGSETLWGMIICLLYLFVYAVYCGMNTFFIFMCIAGDVVDVIGKGRYQAILNLVMCITFAITVYYLFADSLGSISCLPVIIPNCIYYLAKGLETVNNHKKQEDYE